MLDGRQLALKVIIPTSLINNHPAVLLLVIFYDKLLEH